MGIKQQSVSLPWLTLIWPALSAVALTFTNTIPTQCDPLTINWTGGQPPLQLLMIAPNRILYNFTIPSDNNSGSFTIPQLILPQFQRVMFSMSDATGVSSGGITSLLTVGASVSNLPCNTTSPDPDFVFTLGSDLTECSPYKFSQYQGAVQPVTIFGFVPNGTLLTLFPPLGSNFVFNNNLTAGTTVVFYMEDSLGRDGGVADLDIVSFSDDTASCVSSSGDLNSAKATPNSTLTGSNSALPGSSSTTTASNSPSTGTSTNTGPFTSASKSSNVALIAGAAAGGGAAVVLLSLFVRCTSRRRRCNSSRSPLPMVHEWSSTDLIERARQHSLPDITLPHRAVFPFTDASSSTSSFTVAESGTEVGASLNPLWRKEQVRIAVMNGTPGASGRTNAQGRSSPGYATAQRGAGINFGQGGSGYGPSFYASSRPIREGLLSPGVHPLSDDHDRSLNWQSSFSGSAQRVIVHADIAQARLMDYEQPLELPPMYSEGRRSIPGLLSYATGSSPTVDTRSQKGP